MSNLRILRMTTGEDVLAKVEQVEEHYHLTKAVTIVPNQNQSVNFIPYSPFTEKDAPIRVHQSSVIFKEKPAHEFEQHHAQMFGEIVTNNQSIIVP